MAYLNHDPNIIYIAYLFKIVKFIRASLKLFPYAFGFLLLLLIILVSSYIPSKYSVCLFCVRITESVQFLL